MSSSRPPRAPPTPSPSPAPHHSSKLPKFLQKQTRDRSKSVIEPIMQHGASADSNMASSSSSSIASPGADGSPASSPRHRSDRRSSKLKGVLKELKDDRIGAASHADRDRDYDRDPADESMEEAPVIVEPIAPSPRPRTRSERPLSASSSDSHHAVSYYPSHSSQRLSDMGTRLSGWFSHTFNSSSTDLSLPTILSNAPAMAMSPKSKSGGLGLLTAARHGKGHLDKAVRYLLDSDSTPDKCTEPIWLLGVQHPGYEAPPPPPPRAASPPPSGRRSSLDMRRSSSFRNSVTSMRGAMSSPEPSSVSQQQQQVNRNPAAYWPPVFYADFTSRVWLTYRSHYPPIRDHTLAQLEAEFCSPPSQSVATSPRKWNWPVGGEKGWTSDSGWGCMLRTGQSLLANALIHLHLGRDWRRPPHPVHTADYATYVKILTWFFDSPDPHCPFSVHRMALAGKDLGKDVGSWFGPSTAAGAIKTLVHAFAEAGLGVSVATDGVVYETDVLAASNAGPYMFRHSRMATSSPSTRRRRSGQPQSLMSIWGQRPVLVLVGIRLGIDGVNPVYYEAVKALYTFPQSVGIAGGRPSSSYYFVGAQADNLFYLDPHHARPTVPLRHTPSTSNASLYNPADSPPTSFREMRPMPGHVQASSSSSSYVSRMSPSPSQGSASGQSMSGIIEGELDATQEHYVSAYSPSELRTFHCDRVRKMPLSGLDPSMLLGFLCRDERDWRDLRERVSEMSRKYKAIFSIQDEPPSWPSDSDEMGMESVSDVEIDIDGPADAFSLSPEPEEGMFDEERESKRVREDGRGRQSEEVTTEEDDIADPVTPGPGMTAQTFEQASKQGDSFKSMDLDEDLLGDDEDWVDPSMPTPQPREAPRFPIIPMSTASSAATTASYVSASSSYSNLQPAPSKSMNRNGSGSRDRDKEREREREKENENKGRPSRTSKTKSSKSGSSTVKHEASASQQSQEYFPFPVVDDREPDEADDFHELSSQSDSSRTQHHTRQRTGTAASSRTPVASVIVNNTSTNGSGGAGGSRIRNAFARDGGRTQSGGVRGIVTSDLEDNSDF
ncbi:hypothetical protein DFH11DRAFT_1729456 [Phellopilus nigrolimitatus]|nr:hypothetical protein DFH11DRAFT_1729456 [Phellopilus nigrolimitatus]